MESHPDAQIKTFLGVRLPRGDKKALLLKNSMLYAYELDSQCDFLEYFDTLNQSEPVEETDNKPMFYAEKILNCLIETLEKNDREEKAKEAEKKVKEEEQPAPEETARKEDEQENEQTPQDEAEKKAEEGTGDQPESKLEKSMHQEEQNQSKELISHPTQKDSETKRPESAGKDQASNLNKSQVSDARADRSFHEDPSEKKVEVHHEEANPNLEIAKEGEIELVKEEHQAPVSEEKSHNQHSEHPELLGNIIAAAEDKKLESNQQLNSSMRNEETAKNDTTTNHEGEAKDNSGKNPDLDRSRDKNVEISSAGDYGQKDEPETKEDKQQNSVQEHEKVSVQNDSAVQEKEFPQVHQEQLTKQIESEDKKDLNNLGQSKNESGVQVNKTNESVHQEAGTDLSKDNQPKSKPNSAQVSKDQITNQENDASQRKDQEEEEAARQKLKAEDEEKAAQQKREIEEEEAQQKLKAQAEEAARLKLKAEEEDAANQKLKAQEEEAAQQKLKVQEEEAARLKLKAEEEEAANQKLKAQEDEIARQKLKAPEEEAARLKLKAEEEEAANQKLKAQEEEAAQQKLETQEEEAARLKLKAEEEEAANQKLKAQEEEAAQQKLKAQEEEENRQKLKAQEDEIARQKLNAQEEETARQILRAQEEEEAARQKLKAQEEESAKAQRLLEEQEREAELKRKQIQEEEELKKKEWEAKEAALAEKLKLAEQEAEIRKKKLEEEEEAVRKQKEAEKKAADELAKQRLKEEEEAKIKLQEAEAASQRIKDEALAEAQRKKIEADQEAQKRKEEAEKEARLHKEQAENEAERRKRDAEEEIIRKREEFEQAQKAKADEAERLAKIKREEAEREALIKQKEAEEKALKIQQQAEADAERRRIEAELTSKKAQNDAEALARKRKEEAEAEALRIKEAATAEANRIKEAALAQAKAQIEAFEKDAQKRRKEEEERAQTTKNNNQKAEPAGEEKINPSSTKYKQSMNITPGTIKISVGNKDPKQETRVSFSKPADQNNKSQIQGDKRDSQRVATDKSVTQEMPTLNSDRTDQNQDKNKSISQLDKTDSQKTTLELKAVNQRSQDTKIALEKFQAKLTGQARVNTEARGASLNRPTNNRNIKPAVGVERKINNLVREEQPKPTTTSLDHSIGPVTKQKSGGNRNMTSIGTTTAGRKSFSTTMNNYRTNSTISNPKPQAPVIENSQLEDTEAEKRPITANLVKSNSGLGIEKKDRARHSDIIHSSQLPKQNQTPPVRARDNLLLNDKTRQPNDMRPKTREKLAPLNKSNLVDSDFMFNNPLEDRKNNNKTEDPVRENMTFKKWNTNKGEWRAPAPVGKPLNGLDVNNPYNPNWTKWVLRNHFDVNIEAADDHQGVKWKIRKVKNPKNRKSSPDRQNQESKAEHGAPTFSTLKGYQASNGKKNTENKRPEKKASKTLTTLADIQLGVEIIPASIYLNNPETYQTEASNREFDTNWLAQTLLTLTNQGPRDRNSSVRSPENDYLTTQLIGEMPLFHPKFLSNLEELKKMALLKQQIIQNRQIIWD